MKGTRRWLGALVAGLLVIGLVAYLALPRAVRHAPGMLAPEDPQQTELAEPKSWVRGPYRISTLAGFKLKARVLHAERYRFDREADLAPVDLALGWGPMSDQRVVDELSFSQGMRWYEWSYERQPPIAREDIARHSANMHMIPGDEHVERRLKSVRTGQIVDLSGYLVSVSSSDGYRWTSSTTRDDTGGGSCEVVWIEALSVAP